MKLSSMPPDLRARVEAALRGSPASRPAQKLRQSIAQGVRAEDRQAWEAERKAEPGLFMPQRVISEANTHTHWTDRAKRAARQKEMTLLMMRGFHPPITLPATVTLVRYGPGRLDDDNLEGAFKAVRDGVAEFVGVDDGDERWTWLYDQHEAKFYGVRVVIEEVR